MDKIFIKGLDLNAVIGIYPHERTTKQPILLDIEMIANIHVAAHSGDIRDTVDYASVAERVRIFVEQSQFELIESLVENVAELILREFNIRKICCTLYKPQALVNAQTVGVYIERESNKL